MKYYAKRDCPIAKIRYGEIIEGEPSIDGKDIRTEIKEDLWLLDSSGFAPIPEELIGFRFVANYIINRRNRTLPIYHAKSGEKIYGWEADDKLHNVILPDNTIGFFNEALYEKYITREEEKIVNDVETTQCRFYTRNYSQVHKVEAGKIFNGKEYNGEFRLFINDHWTSWDKYDQSKSIFWKIPDKLSTFRIKFPSPITNMNGEKHHFTPETEFQGWKSGLEEYHLILPNSTLAQFYGNTYLEEVNMNIKSCPFCGKAPQVTYSNRMLCNTCDYGLDREKWENRQGGQDNSGEKRYQILIGGSADDSKSLEGDLMTYEEALKMAESATKERKMNHFIAKYIEKVEIVAKTEYSTNRKPIV